MQAQATPTQTFAMRRDAAGLLVGFNEWQALRAAWEGLVTRLVPDIPCPPEDVYPEDHGVVVHVEAGKQSIA